MRTHLVALVVFGHLIRSLWSYRMVDRCFLDLKLSLDHDCGGPEGQGRGLGPVFARRKMIPTLWNRGVIEIVRTMLSHDARSSPLGSSGLRIIVAHSRTLYALCVRSRFAHPPRPNICARRHGASRARVAQGRMQHACIVQIT